MINDIIKLLSIDYIVYLFIVHTLVYILLILNV